MTKKRPGEIGGTLIRRVIKVAVENNFSLPIASHILIATSAGSDSIALATLIAKYGLRVGSKLTLLHVNHHWRGKESDRDAVFVENLARKLGVDFILRDADRPTGTRESWEDLARTARKKIYEEEAARLDAVVLTAHHGDDLAETVLWRILTGAADTHGGGIRFQEGREIRFFLTIRKDELKAFLKEERQSWREDRTNRDPRFLRAKMRKDLMPRIEKIFPKAVQHLISLGLKAQKTRAVGSGSDSHFESLFGVSGVRVRRPHWESLKSAVTQKPNWRGEFHLPGGWRLSRPDSQRWILERLPKSN